MHLLLTAKALHDDTSPAIHLRKGRKGTTPAALQVLVHELHGVRPPHSSDLVKGERK
jgi:hypothetical protein